MTSQELVCDVAGFFAHLGYITNSSGQISVRDSNNPQRWWTFPLGVNYKKCSPKDLIAVDQHIHPSHRVNFAAAALHNEIYKTRLDVNAILHYHPKNIVAWSTTHLPLPLLTQESGVFYNDIAYVPFEGIVESLQESKRVVNLIGSTNTALLFNHGAITLGKSLKSAAYRLILLEQCCETALLAGGKGVGINDIELASLHSFFTTEEALCYLFDMFRINNR